MALRQRPGDQPLPKTGKIDVGASVIDWINTEMSGPATLKVVMVREFAARIDLGVERYGKRLETNNGRDALLDLKQELLDAAHYARQWQLEKPNEPLADVVFGRTMELARAVIAMEMRR